MWTLVNIDLGHLFDQEKRDLVYFGQPSAKFWSSLFNNYSLSSNGL